MSKLRYMDSQHMRERESAFAGNEKRQPTRQKEEKYVFTLLHSQKHKHPREREKKKSMQRFFFFLFFFFRRLSFRFNGACCRVLYNVGKKRTPRRLPALPPHDLGDARKRAAKKKKRSNRASLGILQEGSRRKRSPPLSTDFAGLLPLQAVKEHAEMFHFCQRLFLG